MIKQSRNAEIQIYHFSIGDIEYWNFDEELKKLEDEISSNPSVRSNSFNYWYTPFHENCCNETESDCTTGNRV